MRSQETGTERRDGPESAGPSRRWPILTLLSLAGFMVILDVTVVNVALPQIGRSLGFDREALTWVVTAYTVAFGGLQHAEQYSPLRTGLTFLPVALGTAVGAHLAARTVTTLGPRPVGSAGMTLAAAGLALMAWRGVGGGVAAWLLPGFVLAAIGLGTTLVTATTSGLAAVEHQHAGVAFGILNTGHELGGALSIAAISAAALAGAALLLLPQGRLALDDRPTFVH